MKTKLAQDAVVVDASYILSLLLSDELATHQNVSSHLYAPTILTYETVNGLRSAALQNRITQTVAHGLYLDYCKLPLKLIEPDFSSVLKLSFQHNLSIYDASYLTLSKELKIPLKTYDKHLTKLV